MQKGFKVAAFSLAMASAAFAAPASATIFEYTMNDGDVLKIDTANNTGSWVGDDINTTFTGDFSQFQGGRSPRFSFTLTSLDGTRLIRGETFTPTNRNGNRTHPFMLKSKNNGQKVNLWSWWGNPVVAGDYIRKIVAYEVTPPTEVPAPGVLGLFGLALVALGFGRRRHIQLSRG